MFNTYFNNITKELNLKAWTSVSGPIKTLFSDPVSKALVKYRDHPSIIKIRSYFGEESTFNFSEVTAEKVNKIVMSLNSSKATSGNISTKLIKLASKVCSPKLASCINSAIKSAKFPDPLKFAKVTPVFKKGDQTLVQNYRPISILPTVSKIFEKVLASQLEEHFKTRFSNLLCGFRKGYSSQHALLRLLQNWQSNLDKSNVIGTVLMDLSKAYDCLPHDLLIAKLAVYGIDHHSLTLLHDYLLNRFQRVKIGNSFSEWLKILIGVPQGSILGPLLFNIFINDLLFSILNADICNFADDNTLYTSGKSADNVTSVLQCEIENVLNWFELNSMVANPAKFQIMFLGTKESISNFNIQNISVPVSDHVKLLGIKIDSNLNFKSHINDICNKAAGKTRALLRIRPFISQNVAKSLCNAYVLSQFNYCPVIWMACDNLSNAKINKVHLRALRTIQGNFKLDLAELMVLQNEVTIHVKCIWKLLTEVYKSCHGLNPPLICDLFQTKNSGYTLRSGHQLTLPPTKTKTFGLRSKSFMGSLLWNKLPKEIKEAKSVSNFKTLLKRLGSSCCNCSLCTA